MEEMRKLVENYQSYIDKSDILHNKLMVLLDYDTKVSASYGHNTGASKGSISSKVENHALKIKEIEEKIFELEEKIRKVNIAERVLNDKEKEVIDLIKKGNSNRLSVIAKALKQNKKYVFDVRNRALRKMASFLEGR